ncbi:hypothetical protein N7522_006642 [Penicillium canescens]|uniref:Uncharacterized protein n=1 Tax=Penicillium canescens TaxID=5083 RepID=A0AAD6I8V7_PENCN|nr:uncharacterized protein N7446_010282 [Penicillium canescens]KAJ6001415.1 hypothetical protein N7522_006642 [Penicillium canescens]KAJ6035519.1 hypothetical protein N7460_009694 [Penicillium canescens]KAJ6054270.1 hypothetical protein N7446_010282 [Penicillium canescens]
MLLTCANANALQGDDALCDVGKHSPCRVPVNIENSAESEKRTKGIGAERNLLLLQGDDCLLVKKIANQILPIFFTELFLAIDVNGEKLRTIKRGEA